MWKCLAAIALLAALPASAQGAERHWYLDVHRFTPSLAGHFRGVSDGQPINLDLTDDLALGREKTRAGLGLEYQGSRFGLEVALDRQDYAGQNRMARDITIEGQTFKFNTQVTSRIQATNASVNWTTRCYTWPQYWLGLDLGARVTTLKLNANGVNAFTGINAAAEYKATLPVPQIGPSMGFTALDNRMAGRGFAHLLTFKGANYTHLGADLRYFPLPWLGLRVFADSERFRVPNGSIKDDLDITLDRTGTGFGLVVRF